MNKIIGASVSVDNEVWKNNRVYGFGQCQVFFIRNTFHLSLEQLK